MSRQTLAVTLSTKDGVTNQNARLTNCLKERRQTGELAQVRPGLALDTTYAGLGNGLIAFNRLLLTIVDDTIYDDEYTWDLDSPPWSASTGYNYGDSVWYGGQLWFSTLPTIHFGQTPGGGGGYWSSWLDAPTDTYNPATPYNVGDSVTRNGQTYYAKIQSTGKDPLTNPDYWGESPPGPERYYIANVNFNGTPLGIGPVASTRDGAAIGAYPLITYLTCEAPHYTGLWSTGIAPINNVGAIWYANNYVKVGCAPQSTGLQAFGTIIVFT